MHKLFKHTAAVVTTLAVLAHGIGVFAAADVIKINGVSAEIPTNMGQIREKDERTFVPLRFVSEFLQNEVWYDDATKMASVSSPDMVILVQDGNTDLFSVSKLTGENTKTKMDTAAYIEPEEGRMYLPIRFLAEVLGYNVGWDEATQTVTLDKK